MIEFSNDRHRVQMNLDALEIRKINWIKWREERQNVEIEYLYLEFELTFDFRRWWWRLHSYNWLC